ACNSFSRRSLDRCSILFPVPPTWSPAPAGIRKSTTPLAPCQNRRGNRKGGWGAFRPPVLGRLALGGFGIQATRIYLLSTIALFISSKARIYAIWRPT